MIFEISVFWKEHVIDALSELLVQTNSKFLISEVGFVEVYLVSIKLCLSIVKTLHLEGW